MAWSTSVAEFRLSGFNIGMWLNTGLSPSVGGVMRRMLDAILSATNKNPKT